MKRYMTIILFALCCFCCFSLLGCGAMERDDNAADLDLRHGYWELNSLSGYGIAEVNRILGEELAFVEEKSGLMNVYASAEGHLYYFWKEPDALYCIDYMNLTIEEAYEIAKQSHDALVALYGEDHSGPGVPKAIHYLESVAFLEKDYRPEKAPEVKQYGESWDVPYNDRLGEKVKDFLDVENVGFVINLLTPAFMRDIGKGEAFSVRVVHSSMMKQ